MASDKYQSISVLVFGIIGGLLIAILLIVLWRYCINKRKRRAASLNTKSGYEPLEGGLTGGSEKETKRQLAQKLKVPLSYQGKSQSEDITEIVAEINRNPKESLSTTVGNSDLFGFVGRSSRPLLQEDSSKSIQSPEYLEVPSDSVRGRSQSLSKSEKKLPLGQCKRAGSHDKETISRSVSDDETNKQSSFETVTSPVPLDSYSVGADRPIRPIPPRNLYGGNGEPLGQYYDSLSQPQKHPVVRYSKSNAVYQSTKLPEPPVAKSGRSMYPRNHQSSYSYPSRPTMLQLQQPSLRRPFLTRQPPVQPVQSSPEKLTDSSESDRHQHFRYSNEKLRSPNRSVLHISPKRSAEYLNVPDGNDTYVDHRRSPMMANLRAKSFEANDRRGERFSRPNKSLDGGTFDQDDIRDSPRPTETSKMAKKPARMVLTSTDDSDVETHQMATGAKEQIKTACKLLWTLRSTFEDQSDNEVEPSHMDVKPTLNQPGNTHVDYTSTSNTTSFDSVTDPVSAGDIHIPRAIPGFLLPPAKTGTFESRRQNYRNLLIQRQKITHHSSFLNSFDSGDTPESNCTDATKAAEAFMTSFESNTSNVSSTMSNSGFNTDSTVDSSSKRKLLKLKRDSGYKSQSAEAHPTLPIPKICSPDLHRLPPELPDERRLNVRRDFTSKRARSFEAPRHDYDSQLPEMDNSWRNSSPQQPYRVQMSPDFFPDERLLARKGSYDPDFVVDRRSDAVFRDFDRYDPQYEGNRPARNRRQSFLESQQHYRHTFDYANYEECQQLRMNGAGNPYAYQSASYSRPVQMRENRPGHIYSGKIPLIKLPTGEVPTF